MNEHTVQYYNQGQMIQMSSKIIRNTAYIQYENRLNNLYSLPDVSGLDGQEGDVDLPPICLTLVGQVVQHQRHMVVAVVCHDVMVCLTEYLVGLVNGLIPLISSVLFVIQY